MDNFRAEKVKQEIEALIQEKKLEDEIKKQKLKKQFAKYLDDVIIVQIVHAMKEARKFIYEFNVSDILREADFEMSLLDAKCAMRERFISLGYKCTFASWMCTLEI